MKHTYLIFCLFFIRTALPASAQTDTFRVVFAYNSAEIPAHFPNVEWDAYDHIEVRAYSSGPGSPEYNMQLSKKRARNIQAKIESPAHTLNVQTLCFGDRENPDLPDSEEHRTALIICKKPPVLYAEEPQIIPVESLISIEVRDILTQQKISNFKSTKGEKKGAEQAFHFSAEGYKDTTVFLSGKNNVAFLTPVQVKQLVRMENLLFYPNSPVLLPESERVLTAYLNQLKDNTEDCFEIHGHVNAPYGMEITQTQPQLQALSESRAHTVYKAMRRNGIPASRMVFKGYSNTRMLYPNARIEAEMRQNRRVEIIVTDCSPGR